MALPTPKVVACADALEQAYHQARLLSPALTCLRVETGNIPGELLEAAALELERRGWTVTPVPTANFPNDEIATAHALWLKPYA